MIRIKKLAVVFLSVLMGTSVSFAGIAEDSGAALDPTLPVETVWDLDETEEAVSSDPAESEPEDDRDMPSDEALREISEPEETGDEWIPLGEEEEPDDDLPATEELPDMEIDLPLLPDLIEEDTPENDSGEQTDIKTDECSEADDGQVIGAEEAEDSRPVMLRAGTVLYRGGEAFAELTADGVVRLELSDGRVTFTRDGETCETAYTDEFAEYDELSEAARAEIERDGLPPIGLYVYETRDAEILTYEMAAYGVPGLQRGLTASESRVKSVQAEHRTARTAASMIPGEDYVPGILLLTTGDENYAREAAEAVDGTLLRCENGLAVIRTEADAVKIMEAVCDPYAKIPPFSLNYRYRIGGSAENGGKTWKVSEDIDLNAVPVRGTWATMKGNDPFLQDPGADTHYRIDRDVSSGYQYMHSMVDTWSAWQFSTGKGVTVGIIDSGVYSSHEDFEGAVSDHPISFMLDGEQQTFSGTVDDYGHGTHVAGIIGARRNRKGGAGIAPDVSMISYRATDEYGYMDSEAIVAAVNAAAQDGPWVVNCSFGGLSYNQAEADAFAALIASGTAVIAAAGNDSGMVYNYPAGYPDVISVSAVDPSGMRAPYSSYGTSTLSAPGSFILSTFNGAGKYRSWSGTSMATPVVTGSAALYYSYRQTRDLNGDGAVDAQDVRTLKKKLTASCTKVTGSSTGMGAGIVNAGNLFSGLVAAAEVIIDQKNSDGTVPSDAMIRLESGYDGATMVYTLDGSAPSVKGTKVTNGKVYSGPFEAGTGAVKAGKRTLKVLTIDPSGTRSKVLSYGFTLDSKTTSVISFDIGSGVIVPGKSVTLKAAASPLTLSKPVWKVLEGAATISSGGVLKADKTAQTGSIIRIGATINGFTAETTVEVVPALTAFMLQDTLGRLLGSKETLLLKSGVSRMDFVIAAQAPNGRSVSAKDFEVTVSPASKCSVSRVSGMKFRLMPSAPGKVTVKVKALDGSGMTRSFTVNFKQGILSITPNLPYNAVVGKSITLSASIYPSNASTRTLKWSVDEESAALGIKIAKGKLSVPKTVPEGHCITVTAQATDGTGVSAGNVIYTLASAPQLYLTASDPKLVCSGEKAVSLKLFTCAVEGSDFDGETPNNETYADLKPNRIGGANFAWSSSKTSVATVSDSGRVTAVSPGSATVTCKALDGSGARTTLKVTVVTPVTGMTLSPDTNNMSQLVSTLSLGRSLTVKPYLSSEYGKATFQAVRYETAVYRMVRSNSEVSAVTGSQMDISEASCAVRVTEGLEAIRLDSKGKLTVDSTFSAYMNTDGYLYFVQITARAADGSGVCAKHLVVLDKPDKIFRPEKVELYWFDESAQEMIPQNVSYVVQQDVISENTGSTYYDIGISTEDRFSGDFVVESSEPDVACIGSTLYRLHYNGRASYLKGDDGYYPAYRFFVYGIHPGEATITIRFTDGTNQKASFRVKVVPR